MTLLRVLAGVALAVLGTLSLGALRLPAAPDLFLLPVADGARRGESTRAMLAGLLAGLLEDALTNPPRLLGLHAFSKVLLGYLLSTIGARTLVEKPLAVGGLLSGAVFVEASVTSLLLLVLRGEGTLPLSFGLVARAASTGAVGALLYAASRIPWRARWAAHRRRRLS